jgi:hypothetical protein
VEDAPRLLQFAEFIQFRAADLLGEPAKFAEDLQLQFPGHFAQFRRADGGEDDLKGVDHKFKGQPAARAGPPALKIRNITGSGD